MPIIQLQFKGWLSYSETGGETVITIQGKLNLFDMIFLKFVSYEKMIISTSLDSIQIKNIIKLNQGSNVTD